MDIAGRLDSWTFKVLIHKIFEQYYQKELELEGYRDGIEKGTNGIEKGKDLFFGSRNYNPFPRGSKVKRGKAYHKTRTLKSEILNDVKLVLRLKDYHEISAIGDEDSWNWRKASRNYEKGYLKEQYPALEKKYTKQYLEYLDVIEKAGISEAAFCFIAQEFRTEQLYAQYDKYFKEEITFSFKKNLDVYCLYAGFRDLNEAKEKGRELERLREENRKNNIFKYVGFYYTFRKHAIFEEFKLIIDANKELYKIKAKGFYFDKSKIYEGDGENVSGKVHVRLQEIGNGTAHHYIHMILECGPNFKERQCIRGAFMGVSDYIFNKEIILIKEIDELVHTHKLDIKRYLFCHRNTFRIKVDQLRLNNIQVEDRNVKRYENIIGSWKMWRFDENFNILESLLHIGNDYKIAHYLVSLDRKTSRQYCDFKITHKDYGDVLCSASVAKGRVKIVDFLMIDVPRKESCNSTQGLMISNNTNKPFPIKRALILKKAGGED